MRYTIEKIKAFNQQELDAYESELDSAIEAVNSGEMTFEELRNEFCLEEKFVNNGINEWTGVAVSMSGYLVPRWGWFVGYGNEYENGTRLFMNY